MTVAANPDTIQEQDALKGWNYLTQVLAVWIPARLRVTHRATQGFATLKGKG